MLSGNYNGYIIAGGGVFIGNDAVQNGILNGTLQGTYLLARRKAESTPLRTLCGYERTTEYFINNPNQNLRKNQQSKC